MKSRDEGRRRRSSGGRHEEASPRSSLRGKSSQVAASRAKRQPSPSGKRGCRSANCRTLQPFWGRPPRKPPSVDRRSGGTSRARVGAGRSSRSAAVGRLKPWRQLPLNEHKPGQGKECYNPNVDGAQKNRLSRLLPIPAICVETCKDLQAARCRRFIP